MNDVLGDRMKEYEAQSSFRLMPMLPTFARVDGRSFHTFTKGLKRPYDSRLSAIMVETAHFLAKETCAKMVYTQSDEITIMWYSEDFESKIWFDGKHSKMVSQIAALATLQFYRVCLHELPDYAEKLPTFDARVWQVPTKAEAINVFLWRELDATKNSISMAAQSVYSHSELHGKNSSEKQEMLFQKGINWNDYPGFFKRGTYFQKRTIVRPFTAEEIDTLPPKHEARFNPDLKIERSDWVGLDLPPIRSIVNKEDVIFNGKDPETFS